MKAPGDATQKCCRDGPLKSSQESAFGVNASLGGGKA